MLAHLDLMPRESSSRTTKRGDYHAKAAPNSCACRAEAAPGAPNAAPAARKRLHTKPPQPSSSPQRVKVMRARSSSKKTTCCACHRTAAQGAPNAAPSTLKQPQSSGDQAPAGSPQESKCCSSQAKAASGAPNAAPATGNTG